MSGCWITGFTLSYEMGCRPSSEQVYLWMHRFRAVVICVMARALVLGMEPRRALKVRDLYGLVRSFRWSRKCGGMFRVRDENRVGGWLLEG